MQIHALRLLTAAALVVTTAAILPAQTRFAVLMKRNSYVQTSATVVTAHPNDPYAFFATIDGTATTPPAPNSVTLPNGGATKALVWVTDDEEWRFQESFSTAAARDAAYPDGTYGFTLGGQATTVSLTGGLFPNAPVATLSQGTFGTNGTLVFERTQPLTITLQYGAGFVSGSSRLAISVWGPGFDDQVSTDASEYTQSQVSLVIPANSVAAGTPLTINLEANRVLALDTTKFPGFTLATGYTSETDISAVASGVAAPQFRDQPRSQTIPAGSTVVFSGWAENATTYQWRRDGLPIPNATGARLVLSGASTIAGTYTLAATNAGGTTVSQSATLTVYGGVDVGRLTNLSIRANAGTGAETLIVGLSVGGSGTAGAKPLLIRGLGPTLAPFLPNFLADPMITAYQGETVIATNDNWAGDATVQARGTRVWAHPLISNASLDAALAPTPVPGVFSVHVTGKAGGSGIALAEIYDASEEMTATTPRLINVSARTHAGTGDNVLIAGFYVGGSTSRTVLIRGLGPTLAGLGVPGALADPQLKLYTGEMLIWQNDNWGGDQLLVDVGNSVYAYEVTDRQSRDAMMLVTLAPGGYTVHLGGVNNGTGVGLVEVYEVP